jgi:type II secretory pathway pseudopilin PulG
MRSVMCPGCGLVGWAEAGDCKRCGQPLPKFHRQAPRVAPPPPQDFGGGYNYAPAPDYYFGEPEKKRTGHAVASLVIGVIGFFTLGILLIGSLVGMLLGIAALKKESSQPQVYGGKGIAVAGIIVNVVALLSIAPVGIVAAIAIPNLLASRRAANEASAIRTLRVITQAEDTYQSTAGAGKFGDINQLAAAGLVEKQLLSGPKHGYAFNVTLDEDDFNATATPVDENTGTRSFCVSSYDGGELHFRRDGQPARYNDPRLESAYGAAPRRVSSGTELQGPAMIPAQ